MSPRLLVTSLLLSSALLAAAQAATTCNAWQVQGGPASDRTGYGNTNFPEASTTTYWTTKLSGPVGATWTIHGIYPLARFTALEIYTGDQLVDHIPDIDIQPDPGQNNPYLSGTAAGTYTVTLVVGPAPVPPAPNTLYTGTLTNVVLMYRIYHATDPNDPAAGAPLPQITTGGSVYTSCPVRPFLANPTSTPWGRLALGDWMGTPPTAAQRIPATNPVPWSVTAPYSAHFFPNGADYYMSATLSRSFLSPHTAHQVYVMRFLAPTFPDTRGGEPVWIDRQVHFWSMCTDDPYTTNVNRCIPDDQVQLAADGTALFVVSDPGSKPSDASLAAFKGNWIAWGALDLATDVVYDRAQKPWGLSTPVHFYNALLYRQTDANPSFAQSMINISALPAAQQQAAMGAYWPVGGYCSTAAFESLGFGCIGH